MKLTATAMDGGTIPQHVIAWKEFDVATLEQALFDVRELVNDTLAAAATTKREWSQIVVTLERSR